MQARAGIRAATLVFPFVGARGFCREGWCRDGIFYKNSGAKDDGAGVDPVTLIVTALVAGAAAGLKDTATSAVKDAYNGLKGLLGRKLAGHPAGEVVLAQHEGDPDVWDKPLVQALTAVGAGDDPAVVTAAQALMRLVDEAGSAAGKYLVSASDHSVAAGRDLNVSASGGGVAAGVIHGNVAPGNPTMPGPGEPYPGQ